MRIQLQNLKKETSSHEEEENNIELNHYKNWKLKDASKDLKM